MDGLGSIHRRPRRRGCSHFPPIDGRGTVCPKAVVGAGVQLP
jgi:hypothetical protein